MKIPADAVVITVQCMGCATNKHHKHNGAMLISTHILKVMLALTNKMMTKTAKQTFEIYDRCSDNLFDN